MAIVGLFTDLMIGFSIIAAAILWVCFVWFMPQLQKTTTSIAACTLLLGALIGLQLFHYQVWQTEPALFDNTLYVTLLLIAPPSFYFFSRYVLLPDARFAPWQLVHYLPVLSSAVLPSDMVLTVALALGAGYSLWFVYFVYGMRQTVARYRFELFFFVFFACEAVLVFLLAIALPYIDPTLFHVLYADFTAIAFVLIVATLVIFPEVIDGLTAAATRAYAKPTLDDDQATQLSQRLDALMREDRLYRNESLSLAMVAEQLEIGTHQLSELVNVHHGCSFSTYVRRCRVDEAKQLLVDDQRASVLSISMATGFRSQSNFYVAFREITGESPGAFRKRHQ